MDSRSIAKALGGEVTSRGQINFPAPGHSRADRSASLLLDPRVPGRFLINTRSPADNPLYVKDWVRAQLGWTREEPKRATMARSTVPPLKVASDISDAQRTVRALALWREARDPRGTLVQAYLHSRGLDLPDDAAIEAIRFHPSIPFSGRRTPAMVALVRDVATNAPKAIHRTALDSLGRKAVVGGYDRLSLGPVAGGAIKLTPDEHTTECLGIGEGIESALSLRHLPEFGSSSVWSLISAGGIKNLPALVGIESLWIAVDRDRAGIQASRECAERWRDADREAFLVTPDDENTDLNDVLPRGGEREAA